MYFQYSFIYNKYILKSVSKVIHLKVFDICLLDVKSLQINQNLLDAYKNSIRNIKHLHYILDDWLKRICYETTFLCLYILLCKHQKIWNEVQYT